MLWKYIYLKMSQVLKDKDWGLSGGRKKGNFGREKGNTIISKREGKKNLNSAHNIILYSIQNHSLFLFLTPLYKENHQADQTNKTHKKTKEEEWLCSFRVTVRAPACSVRPCPERKRGCYASPATLLGTFHAYPPLQPPLQPPLTGPVPTAPISILTLHLSLLPFAMTSSLQCLPLKMMILSPNLKKPRNANNSWLEKLLHKTRMMMMMKKKRTRLNLQMFGICSLDLSNAPSASIYRRGPSRFVCPFFFFSPLIYFFHHIIHFFLNLKGQSLPFSSLTRVNLLAQNLALPLSLNYLIDWIIICLYINSQSYILGNK